MKYRTRRTSRSDEVGKQAVYSLVGLLHAADEVAKLLPPEPSEFRSKVLEALSITEIALLRFKMELNFAEIDEIDDEPELDGEELH